MTRLGLLAFAVLGAACLDLGVPQATIHVYNSQPKAVELRLADNAECQLGMTTQINQNTRTTYDVNATGGAFVCVGSGATQGFPVEPNGYYMLKGNQIVVDPHPEGADAASGGILDALEAAGRK